MVHACVGEGLAAWWALVRTLFTPFCPTLMGGAAPGQNQQLSAGLCFALDSGIRLASHETSSFRAGWHYPLVILWFHVWLWPSFLI